MAALKHFKENHEFEDIDVEIIEYDFSVGDSKLHQVLSNYGNFSYKDKVIGVFDCDGDKGKDIKNEGGIHNFGNNIWGMSIPLPEFRQYHAESGISIEFLYKDEDLKRCDENGRRIYLTSEFDENGRLKENKQIGVRNLKLIKNFCNPVRKRYMIMTLLTLMERVLHYQKKNSQQIY